MKVGDKVRMLRGREEGIVTRIIDQKLIEIEIEDGFQIPVLKNEVVVVAGEESAYFKRDVTAAPAPPPSISKKAGGSPEGFYVAYKPLNDRQLSVHLINNSPHVLLFSITEEKGGAFHSVASGVLQAKQAHKFAQTDLQEFERWPIWHLRLLPHPEQKPNELPTPLHQRLQPKAASFFKSLKEAPVLNTKSYLIALNVAPKINNSTAAQLQEQLQNATEQQPQPVSGRPPQVVDLHLEKLGINPQGIQAADILQQQLETFEKTLDRAIATGMEEITFIHGVGNGTLRNEIHKRLSNLNSIAWFKDAQRERWGYGATQVRLK